MAKKFAGFKRDAMEKKILPALGYTGSMDQKMINAFLASNPRAAAKMGQYTLAARQRIEGVRGMSYGGMVKRQGYAPGGDVKDQFNALNALNADATDQFNAKNAKESFETDFGAPANVTDQFNAQNAKESFETNFGAPASAAIKEYQTSLIKELGFDPSNVSPDQHQDYIRRMQEFSNTDPTVLAARSAQEAMKQNMQGYATSVAPPAIHVQKPKPRPAVLQDYDTASGLIVDKRNTLAAATQNLAENPENAEAKEAMEAAQIALTQAEASGSSARSNLNTVTNPTAMTAEALLDPLDNVQTADVETVTGAEKTEGTIAAGTGKVAPPATATTTLATASDKVSGPADTDAAVYDATEVSVDVKATLDKLEAATGKPSDEALATAANMKPGDLAALGLTVEQIAEARKVVAPAPRKIEEGELISGSSVDMDRVKKETNFEAATGAPSSDATVQGQLTGLMEQFEGSEPPAWAAGAMRAAASQMAARGLSASSMAGQAAIQAAMESAMPIAVQDAQTSATFEMQNLSNRQQSAMFAAEKRAEFLNLEFTQEFQTRVSNAAKVSDIANMNFSADVQIALENARMAQTVDLANLDAKNAKIMADAAAMTNVDLTNLNNRQEAAVQNANAFLNMDMKNLDNEQQTATFKTQELVTSMLSDQAATNAAAQFNATSENQTNQFFSSLTASIAQFNSEQANAMERFNAGETNAISQFNTLQKNAADQFNAKNHLVVAQANAQWFQTITTAENAANNQANRDEVLAANNLTMTAYNNVVQRERDLLAWAWQSADNAAGRDSDILIAKIDADASAASSASEDNFSKAAGQFLTKLAVNAADKFFS